MVDLKRAVPKELPPSPARSSPLGAGYSYGVSRVNNLLNGYAQGFSLGGYGLRMNGRLVPLVLGEAGLRVSVGQDMGRGCPQGSLEVQVSMGT